MGLQSICVSLVLRDLVGAILWIAHRLNQYTYGRLLSRPYAFAKSGFVIMCEPLRDLRVAVAIRRGILTLIRHFDELTLIKLEVKPTPLNQFRMRTHLADAPFINHADHIGIHDCA